MNYKKLSEDCITWTRSWFEANGKGCNAILGISGGKDSTVAAAICAKALGNDHVIGVAMPSNNQGINDADEICKFIGIRYMCLNIGTIDSEFSILGGGTFSKQTLMNIPPRIRMTVLYAVAQSNNGMVANTCNLSEDYIGYATIYGDASGSFSPLGKLCVREVRGIGRELGLPLKWVEKIPDDGLPGSCPDEEKFGFSYETLDKYIREGVCEDKVILEKILTMHERNRFKTDILHIPTFNPDLKSYE